MANRAEIERFSHFINCGIPAKTYRAYLAGLKEWGWIIPAFYHMTEPDKLIEDAFNWGTTPECILSWVDVHKRWSKELLIYRLEVRAKGDFKLLPARGECNSIW